MNAPVGATLATKPSKRGGRRRGSQGGTQNVNTNDTSAAPTPTATSIATRQARGTTQIPLRCPVRAIRCDELCDGLTSSNALLTHVPEGTTDRGQQAKQKKGKRGGSCSRALQSSFAYLPYPRGIVNNSNYCFMNSVMQALAFIPPFAQLAVCAAQDPEASAQLPNLTVVGKWLLEYWKPAPPRLCVRPPRFHFSMQQTRGTTAVPVRGVDGSVQEDAQEFLHLLLEHIQLELSAFEAARGQTTEEPVNCQAEEKADAAASTDEKGWVTVKGNTQVTVREHVDSEGRSHVLDTIFAGTLESRLQGKAKQKNRVSSVVERYYTLPVDIGFSTECTIEDALARTFSVEKIYDEKRDKNLKKALFLDTLPQILILHLRRWAVTAEGELVKLDNRVLFGATLTLPAVVCSNSKRPANDRTYSLVSVVAHRGGATRQGHYVTFLAQHVAAPVAAAPAAAKAGAEDESRRPPLSSDVVLCNDTKVSVEPLHALTKETAYFLVYQKRSSIA